VSLIARKTGGGGGGLLGKKVVETAATVEPDIAKVADVITDDVRALADARSARYAAQEETDYLAVFYFVTQEQRDAFIAGLGVDSEGDRGQFVNGVKASKKLAIELPQSPDLAHKAPEERWSNLARRPT